MSARLILSPTPVMRVFHVAENVFEDEGHDFLFAAQLFYLVWRSAFPDFIPRFEFDEDPAAARVIQRALFRKAKANQ